MTNHILQLPVPILSNESEHKRLCVLRSLRIMDTDPEQAVDEITQFALSATGAEAAGIAFIDEERVWFKSRSGIPNSQYAREISLCQFTIAGGELFEVEDISIVDFLKQNTQEYDYSEWKYYAGIPLETEPGVRIGTLCVLGTKPNKLSEEKRNSLAFLSKIVVQLIHSRRNQMALDLSRQILALLQETNEDFARGSLNKRGVFDKMLNDIIGITESGFGFIGEVLNQDGKRYIKTISITDGKRHGQSEMASRLLEFDFLKNQSLNDHTLRTGQSIILNQDGTMISSGIDDSSATLPSSYMSLAVNDSKGNLIGIIGLANKKIGYTACDERQLQPFVSACSTMIIAMHSSEELSNTEMENRQIYQRLLKAQAIANLGSWEYDVQKNTLAWSDELYATFEIEKDGPTVDYKSYHSRIHPDDSERNDAILEAGIRERKEFSFEERLIFPDGRAKVVQVNGVPVLNDNNIVVALHGTVQDITLRKRQEAEAQRFFNLAVDLLCIASIDGYFIRHSRSLNTTLGYTDEELRSTHFLDFVHPDDRFSTQEEFEFILRGGTSRNFENRYRTKKGDYISLSWTANFDEESQLVYAAAQDITEKKELELNLIESRVESEKSKAKDVFLANMSHEIRTPLNAIIGFNDILSQTTLTSEQRKNVDFIRNASKTLSILINDILDISKLESGKLELEHEPFRLEDVARGVVQMHSSQAKVKGVKLLLSYDQEIPEVLLGDETRLSQILINLISNAIKFTEHGSIELRILESSRSDESASVVFEVRDTGIGIAREKLNLIFERFTQAESFTTRVYGGTGLGLNIVRSLVELHHGKLHVDSEPGVGSTFRFQLDYPIASTQETRTVKSSIVQSENGALEGMQILLVEDNEHNQILAETYLMKQHAQVDIAANGKVAIEHLKKKSYDAILMDIQMPIMDGITTTHTLRQELKINTPVVACSAHAMAGERQKCKEAGMNDYIAKPYSEEMLVSVLAKYKTSTPSPDLMDSDDFAGILSKLEEKMSATYVQKVVGVFKQRLPIEIATLQRAEEERDFKVMEERAHYHAGSLSSLRFSNGFQLAKVAELSAAKGMSDSASADALKLIDYLQNLLSFLNTSVN